MSGDCPDEVDPDDVNKWLLNTDTVDKVVETLMTRGEKVAGGDRLLDFCGYAAARARLPGLLGLWLVEEVGGRNRAAMSWLRRLVSMSKVAGS